MNNNYVSDILAAIKIINPSVNAMAITGESKFMEIPDMDSMTIVNLQMELIPLVGDKANEILPMPEMTISEYANLLCSH